MWLTGYRHITTLKKIQKSGSPARVTQSGRKKRKKKMNEEIQMDSISDLRFVS